MLPYEVTVDVAIEECAYPLAGGPAFETVGPNGCAWGVRRAGGRSRGYVLVGCRDSRRAWRIGPKTHHTTLAPNHRVLAEFALAFERFGHRPLQDIQNHVLVFVSFPHDRLQLCSNRIVPGCITSR